MIVHMRKVVNCGILPTFVIFLSIVFTSCNKDEDVLYFTGSSLVEKWDVRKYFPTYMTYNVGLSGSGVAYLESQRDMFRGENVVIISGGNDVLSIDDLDAYVNRYVTAIHNLQAKRIYLFAIFPRLAFETKKKKKVRALNEKIKVSVDEMMHNVFYIDMFNRFIINGKLNENLFYDGTHLNSWGYDLVSEELKKILP